MNKPKNTRRPDRTGLRTLLFFFILGTIPFYVLGIGLWLFSPEPGRNNNNNNDNQSNDITSAPDNSDATWTPLNSGGSDGITPQISTGIPTLTSVATFDFDFGQPTALQFTPLFTPLNNGGGNATFVLGTPIFVSSPTPIPTRFITATPTLTPAATNTNPPPPPTAIPQATNPPPPTQPPLIPPTDTPSA